MYRSVGTVVLRTLGNLSASTTSAAGAPGVVLGPGKPLAVLIYLSAAPSRTASRAALCELLWADVAERQARQTLRQTLWLLREKLGDGVLVTTGTDITLGDRVEADRDRFLAAASAGAWADAAAAYTGPFAAAALRSSGALGFEQWATGEAEFLRRRFLDVATRLLPDLIKTGEGDAAWRLAARLRDADPDRQENWRAVLDLGSVVLSPAESLAEVSRFEQHLGEAEVPPEPATVSMIAKVRAGQPGERRDPFGASLVGRSEVLHAVLTARREAEGGAARWLHLVGVPGVGKSRVLAEAATQLGAAGWLVANAKGGLGARDLPHGLIVDVIAVLTSLPGAKGASGASLATLTALAHQVAQPGDLRSSETLRLVGALRDLLEAVATERPLALIVDDVHWADAPSLEVLRLLGGRLPQRVLLLTAARPLSGGAPGPEARVVQLMPLSADDTRRLVEDLGTLPDEPWCCRFLVTLQQETGGNPLLVLETLRLADAERLLVREGQRWTVSDPAALERRLVKGGVIESRFAAQTPLERAVLMALAVVGSPLSVEALAAAAESTTDQVRQALYRLEQAGQVVPRGREWAVSHDLITETLVDGVSADARRGIHFRVGGHLAAVAGSNLWLIRAAGLHLLRAESLDELRPVWRQWVTEARRAGDRSSQADLLSDFVGDRLPAPWRRGLLGRPGRALVWVGFIAAALMVVAVGIATTRPHRSREMCSCHSRSWRFLIGGDGRHRRPRRWSRGSRRDVRYWSATRWCYPPAAAPPSRTFN